LRKSICPARGDNASTKIFPSEVPDLKSGTTPAFQSTMQRAFEQTRGMLANGQCSSANVSRIRPIMARAVLPVCAYPAHWMAAKIPSESWPTDTYFTSEWSLFSNGEAVQLFHIPAAATDGDTFVFFRRSDVISTGAIYDTTAYPRFDPREGGSIDGIIEGLNRVLDIAVAGENQEGGTVVIPGRGRLSDETDVANYRDMVTIIRDRIRNMIAKGMSLEQVKQSKPTAELIWGYRQIIARAHAHGIKVMGATIMPEEGVPGGCGESVTA
jgi:hypothetical protein